MSRYVLKPNSENNTYVKALVESFNLVCQVHKIISHSLTKNRKKWFNHTTLKPRFSKIRLT